MCSICGYIGKCHPRCPNYSPSRRYHYCSACGEKISEGDQYIENADGEYRHYDCFFGLKELLEWLGYEIKTMDDPYDQT